jgi:hypothetical protein
VSVTLHLFSFQWTKAEQLAREQLFSFDLDSCCLSGSLCVHVCSFSFFSCISHLRPICCMQKRMVKQTRLVTRTGPCTKYHKFSPSSPNPRPSHPYPHVSCSDEIRVPETAVTAGGTNFNMLIRPGHRLTREFKMEKPDKCGAE